MIREREREREKPVVRENDIGTILRVLTEIEKYFEISRFELVELRGWLLNLCRDSTQFTITSF